ncbi:hypothetical protein [Brevundimonas diminuta]|uniref:hypothetical protein n=1 Tax=Brevundimonas diminuta TaxID=293 RepID=UPI003CFD9C17
MSSLIRPGGVLCLMLAIPALWGSPVAAQSRLGAERRQAEAEAAQWVAIVEQQSCPSFGVGPRIQGFETPGSINAIINEEWAYASRVLDGAPRFIKELAANPAFRNRQADQRDMIATQAAYARASVAKWTLASWARMAQENPELPPSSNSAGPVAPFRSAPASLNRLIATAQSANMQTGDLSRIAVKMQTCLTSIDRDLVAFNAASIRAAIHGAGSTAALDRLARQFELETVASRSGSEEARNLLHALRTRTAELQASELRTRQQQDAASRERARRAQAEAERANAPLLANAQAFISALRRGDTNDAVRYLDDRVAFESPLENGYGKENVTALIRRASGGQGSINAPYLSERGIIAEAQTRYGRAVVSFAFASDGRINFIRARSGM